jgi:hypothetical protein
MHGKCLTSLDQLQGSQQSAPDPWDPPSACPLHLQPHPDSSALIATTSLSRQPISTLSTSPLSGAPTAGLVLRGTGTGTGTATAIGTATAHRHTSSCARQHVRWGLYIVASISRRQSARPTPSPCCRRTLNGSCRRRQRFPSRTYLWTMRPLRPQTSSSRRPKAHIDRSMSLYGYTNTIRLARQPRAL